MYRAGLLLIIRRINSV